jgi:hypothetical protein
LKFRPMQVPRLPLAMRIDQLWDPMLLQLLPPPQ